MGFMPHFSNISPGIKPEVLHVVLLLNERFDDIGVMYLGCCGVVFFNELCLLVGLDVVFVSNVLLTALLRPGGTDLLVAAFVGLVLLLLFGVAILSLPKTMVVALLDFDFLVHEVKKIGFFFCRFTKTSYLCPVSDSHDVGMGVKSYWKKLCCTHTGSARLTMPQLGRGRYTTLSLM